MDEMGYLAERVVMNLWRLTMESKTTNADL